VAPVHAEHGITLVIVVAITLLLLHHKVFESYHKNVLVVARAYARGGLGL